MHWLVFVGRSPTHRARGGGDTQSSRITAPAATMRDSKTETSQGICTHTSFGLGSFSRPTSISASCALAAHVGEFP